MFNKSYKMKDFKVTLMRRISSLRTSREMRRRDVTVQQIPTQLKSLLLRAQNF